jgi:hypothetical protein
MLFHKERELVPRCGMNNKATTTRLNGERCSGLDSPDQQIFLDEPLSQIDKICKREIVPNLAT